MSLRVNKFLPLTTVLPLLLCCCEENSGNNLRSATPVAGENSSDEQPAVTATYEMPVPLVQELAPTYVAAGDVLTAYGKGFVPKRYGSTKIKMRGKFISDLQDTIDVDDIFETNYINSGKINFTFEPAESGFGSEMGTFKGYVWAVNQGNDGSLKEQNEEPMVFNVITKPSVVIESIYPMKATCKTPLLQRSLAGTDIGLDISLIGLNKPSMLNPITVNIIYMDLGQAEQVPCPISQLDLPGCSIGDESGLHRKTLNITTEDDLKFTLEDINFGALPADVLQADGMISIRATDGITTLQRTITITMFPNDYVIDYDGSVEIAEIYAPEVVSGCITGGDLPMNVSYSEGHSESRSRSCGVNMSAGLKIPGLDKILSLGFGMNVSASVSSSDNSGLSVSRQILPNQYAVIYRQTQRLLRRADIVKYSVCGEKTVVGEASLTDWSWSPDIAITHDGICPPYPPSNLPAAQCYINCD